MNSFYLQWLSKRSVTQYRRCQIRWHFGSFIHLLKIIVFDVTSQMFITCLLWACFVLPLDFSTFHLVFHLVIHLSSSFMEMFVLYGNEALSLMNANWCRFECRDVFSTTTQMSVCTQIHQYRRLARAQAFHMSDEEKRRRRLQKMVVACRAFVTVNFAFVFALLCLLTVVIKKLCL